MSPTQVDSLQPGSQEGQVKAAISDCIATEMRAGKSQEQAVAMCTQMAKAKVAPPQQGAPQGGV